MAVGQGVLGEAALDVAALNRIGAAMESRERRRSIDHAAQLTDALAVRRVYADAGMGLSAAAHVALLLACSESRAEHLLHEARTLQDLGALDAMRDGLLSVEQGRVVVDLLGVVDESLGASLWERLAARLVADRAEGTVRPPSRLRELLTRWLIAADPEGCAARRKDAAEIDAGVELWKRGDGLTDLVGRALSPADAIACSDRIELLAQPLGPDDDRTSGQRRQAAFVDLLLGRVALPFDEGTAGASACCPTGSAAPCGAQIFVHVPLPTALGESSKPAELVGHGPIDAALLADLFDTAPILRRVWVDADSGVPVAIDDGAWTPGRDPAALRQALIEMRTCPPPEVRNPIHPDDHLPAASGSSPPPRPRVLTRPHLADPGGYVPDQRLKQLVRARAPRCEWLGCGRRTSRAAGTPCDLDHDLAWPFGPTCSCNLGPLCRRHHRIKQEGWTKHRRADGSVCWTDPTGRTWTAPSQHPRPEPRRRRIAPGVWTLAA